MTQHEALIDSMTKMTRRVLDDPNQYRDGLPYKAYAGENIIAEASEPFEQSTLNLLASEAGIAPSSIRVHYHAEEVIA